MEKNINDALQEIPLESIPHFCFGQAEDRDALTGVSLVLCPEGAVCGVDVRGGSPATRDTDALDPLCNREVVHAVLLAGGSAFGLDAAGGVMQALEAQNIGRDVGVTVVPNVCAAVLFDLKCGRSDVRPDAEMGRLATEAALRGEGILCGSHGAGTGASLGKLSGAQYAMKGGVGTYALRVGDLMVGAVIAVNCMGDVRDGKTILAGARRPDGKGFGNSEALLLANYQKQTDIFSGKDRATHTVIGAVMTNAQLNKSQMNKLASIAHNGLARAIYPAHTTYDGDTLFALSCGEVSADPDAVGILASLAVEKAIHTAIKTAESLGGFPAYQDFTLALGDILG